RFTEAKKHDDSLPFMPEQIPQIARELADSKGIEQLIEQGTKSAGNDWAAAQELFTQAVKLDQDLGLTHSAQSRVVQIWREQGNGYLSNQKIPEAKRAYDAAEELEHGAISGSLWNQICWQGSLGKFAEEVKDACEKAVLADPSDPNNPMYRDSRAVNL